LFVEDEELWGTVKVEVNALDMGDGGEKWMEGWLEGSGGAECHGFVVDVMDVFFVSG
jgi:hypothetical protein